MAAKPASEHRKRSGRRNPAQKPHVVFRVKFADHPELGKVGTVATEGLERPRRPSGLDSYAVLLSLHETLKFAANEAAGRLVDYGDFRSDGEYLGRITAIARSLMPSDIEIVPESIGLPEGTRRTRYQVSGMDSEQRDWRGTLLGATPAEAKLRARLAMTLAEKPPPRDLDALVDSMWHCVVERCEPARRGARPAADAAPKPRF